MASKHTASRKQTKKVHERTEPVVIKQHDRSNRIAVLNSMDKRSVVQDEVLSQCAEISLLQQELVGDYEEILRGIADIRLFAEDVKARLDYTTYCTDKILDRPTTLANEAVALVIVRNNMNQNKDNSYMEYTAFQARHSGICTLLKGHMRQFKNAKVVIKLEYYPTPENRCLWTEIKGALIGAYIECTRNHFSLMDDYSFKSFARDVLNIHSSYKLF